MLVDDRDDYVLNFFGALKHTCHVQVGLYQLLLSENLRQDSLDLACTADVPLI